jgi:hypothetical protein
MVESGTVGRFNNDPRVTQAEGPGCGIAGVFWVRWALRWWGGLRASPSDPLITGRRY